MEKEELPIQEKKQSSNRLFLIIAILFAIIIGGLVWQFFEQKAQYEQVLEAKLQLAAEKDSLRTELYDIQQQYVLMETENDTLNAEIKEQQLKIKEYIAQIEKHKNDVYIIRKLKKETITLREIMKGYLHSIDSLNTINKELEAENQIVKKDLSKQKEKYSSLKKEKDVLAGKVKIGARLKALNFTVTALRVKPNGVNRETTRAAKTSKLKCCFTLDENKIADMGEKDVYLRIIAPNGKVLAEREDDTYTFTFNGVKGLFTKKKKVSYNREKQEVCLYWDIIDKIPEGKYIFEVYADEADIGNTTLTLK